MKAGMRTVLRTAAWSGSAVLVLGVAAGTASAAAQKHDKKQMPAVDDTNGAPADRPKLLHDIATVENGDGTFEECMTQVGTVSATSATSITVVSADKYSATYTIDDDTVVLKDGKKAKQADVAEGDTVFVRAADEDGTVTANVVGDGRPPAGHAPGRHRPPPALAGPAAATR